MLFFFFFFFFDDLLRSLSSHTICCIARKGAENWLGIRTRLGCYQIERVSIICIMIFHICTTIANFWKKKKKGKNESAISRQTDAQRKMNARGSFETEHFFCLA